MVIVGPNVHLSYILEIICNKLQITNEQHVSAEEKYTAVGKWLAVSDSPLYNFQPIIFPQGSFRIGTTVKPLVNDEYDIDLVCHLQRDGTITDPMALLEAVYKRIKDNKIYEPISEKKNRCVRINYKGDFHLDILPARSDPSGSLNYLLVPDRDTQGWKASNPKGYAEWFDSVAQVRIELLEKARIEPLPQYEKLSDKLPLQQTVQLLKRWRDIAFKDKEDFAPPSIVLTTLVGNNYSKALLVVEALTEVLDGIIREMDARTGPIVVLNPSNPKENLSEKWREDDTGYYLFVKLLKELKQQWNDLLKARGIADISSRLEKLFGEKAIKIAIKEYAEVFGAMREEGKLGMDKQTGILSGLGASTMVVKKSTFYGKDI